LRHSRSGDQLPMKRRSLWSRENILFIVGIGIIVFEVINAEVLSRPYHYEFLVLGGALCGVGITQYGDRSGK
jgi:hypothetical protein